MAIMVAEANERLRDRMAAYVRRGEVAGLAWAVGIGDDVIAGTAGRLDPETDERPVPPDGIFRVASVSKPIVAVAALQLVEAGVFGLDDPVDEVLPELADRRVLSDPHGPLDQALVPADRALTLRDLLSFRCGLGMDFTDRRNQPVLERMWELGIGPGPTPPSGNPDEFMAALGTLPLADQPGTRWRYHTGSDIVSVFIERLRGESLDVLLKRDVFDPLGMPDTGFWVDSGRLHRFGVCRMTDDSGAPTVWDLPDGRWATRPDFRSGASGLVSTTGDLLAFGRMLLSGGQGPTGRILDSELVAEMLTDQLTDDQRTQARIDGVGNGVGWGLGVALRHEPDEAGWPPVGSYGWDGGLGSRWLVDPSDEVCAVILTTDAFGPDGVPPVLTDFVTTIGSSGIGP